MIVGWTHMKGRWYVTVRLCTANLMHLAPKDLHYGEKPGWVYWPEVRVPLTREEQAMFAQWSKLSLDLEYQIEKLREELAGSRKILEDAILTRISK